MKKLFTISLLLFVGLNGFGQETKFKKTEFDSNYTWRNSTTSTLDSFYYDLPVVESSDYKTHIRLYQTGQRIDLFSHDNVLYNGMLTNIITEYKTIKTDWGKGSEAFRYISQNQQLDSIISTQLATFILQSGQDTIPTDSIIPAWKKWFLHCEGIIFKFKINNKYIEQSYHCPWSQDDTVEYKNIVVTNYEFVDTQLNLQKRYETFTGLLPSGTYSKDGYIMMYNPKQSKKNIKRRASQMNKQEKKLK